MKLRVPLLTLLAIGTIAWRVAPHARAADAARQAASGGIQVEFNAEDVGPREIEDTTAAAVPRDYATAWSALETSLSQNRASALDSSFIGFARERFAQRIADQQKCGMRVRYVDRGHKVQAIFYSPEGSTMQLRDTAQYDLEVLDGDTVINSQSVTQNYIALMTVTEDRWKVRVMEAVP